MGSHARAPVDPRDAPCLDGRGPRGRQAVGDGRHGVAARAGTRGGPAAPGVVGPARPRRADQLGLLVGTQEEVHRRVAPPQAGRVVGAHRAAREDHAQRRVGGLERASTPIRPMTFCSAVSRMEQVLMTMRSASSRPPASAQPAASRAPAISSESEAFIWQPSVQTWKRGQEATLGGVLLERVVGPGAWAWRLRWATGASRAPAASRARSRQAQRCE